MLQLKAASGDTEELATVRSQLSDQVEHIRKLEISNREQTTELRNLRQSQRSAAILEEEKRSLQIKLQRLDDLEKELAEANYQRQLLADERKAWTAYLQETEICEGIVVREPRSRTYRMVRHALTPGDVHLYRSHGLWSHYEPRFGASDALAHALRALCFGYSKTCPEYLGLGSKLEKSAHFLLDASPTVMPYSSCVVRRPDRVPNSSEYRNRLG